MNPRFESGGKGDDESHKIAHELERLFSEPGVQEKIIDPFINVGDDDLGKKLSLRFSITFLLSRDDDTILKEIRSSDSQAIFFRDAVKEVSQALKQGLISDKASWFKLLEKMMSTFELFVADTEPGIDIEKAKKEYDDWVKEAGDRILKNVLKAKGLDSGSSDSEKK